MRLSKKTSKNISKNKILKLFIILLPFILGYLSTLFISRTEIPETNAGIKPPRWLFGIVWPILYLLLGYSSYLILQKDKKTFKIYLAHLFLLSIWFPLFVKYPKTIFPKISIVIILLSAIYLFTLYSSISKRASYCLIPYIMWLTFATYLTFNI